VTGEESESSVMISDWLLLIKTTIVGYSGIARSFSFLYQLHHVFTFVGKIRVKFIID